MSVELLALLGPYVMAAVKQYGAAVLSKAEESGTDAAADVTVSVGQRVLQRIFGKRSGQEDAPEALAELAAAPDDPDLQAVLRVQIRKALAGDERLAREVREMLAKAPPAHGVTVTASGERSIAAHTISGVAVTGDDSDITR